MSSFYWILYTWSNIQRFLNITQQGPVIPTYGPNVTVIDWTNTTGAMNSTSDDDVKEWRSCNHIFGTYVIPNMLHFFAYLIGFYHFRIQEHEGLYALMEKVISFTEAHWNFSEIFPRWRMSFIFLKSNSFGYPCQFRWPLRYSPEYPGQFFYYVIILAYIKIVYFFLDSIFYHDTLLWLSQRQIIEDEHQFYEIRYLNWSSF